MREDSELDELTLTAAKRGDDRGCLRLVEQYQARVFGLVGRMLLGRGGQALVEDLSQETFLRVFRSLDGFDAKGPARLSTWILTIAARLTVNELKRRTPLAPVEAGGAELASFGGTDGPLHRRQLRAILEQAIAALSPEFRAAFILREVEGLDYETIASALDIDLGTVKSRLSRARLALRDALKEVHDA